jgi:hypothetical protein
VSVVQGPDGDEITFSGQRGVFNNISLDGGDYNNGFFGEQVGGQRAAVDITLDAVKEFQVVANGAAAEFGRTAGGVVNVITKSGTNEAHGSLFYFQRLEGLTSNTSDGKPLDDFHREQFGGTLGGPLVKDRLFFFGAIEGIRENLLRPNLSEAIGTPCPVSSPTLGANEGLINSNADCQRLALLSFFKASRGADEGQPVKHTIDNNAVLGKVDWTLGKASTLSVSYNFNFSNNENQTFDVATYGTSANGTEGSIEDQHPQRQPVDAAHVEPAERISHHRVARVAAAGSNRFEHPGGYRYGLRHVIPLRQSVLPGAERRRTGEALPDQGQPDARARGAHVQGPGQSGCTRTTTRYSAASSKAGTCSTASPDSCATPRPQPQAATGRRPSAARTARTSPRRRLARPARRRPAAPCCSICRAAAQTESPATPRGSPTSTTTSCHSSCRTSGVPAAASPSTTGCAGTRR